MPLAQNGFEKFFTALRRLVKHAKLPTGLPPDLPYLMEQELPGHRTRPHDQCRCRAVARWILGLAALLGLVAMVNPWSVHAEPPVLEELVYRVDVLLWRHALQAKIRLMAAAQGRYRVEVTGEAQGLLSLLTGGWRGCFVTEMESSGGRLRPVLYREEGYSWGKAHLFEYCFSYDRQVVELYRRQDDGTMVKKWEASLDKPIYDFWTVLYNLRLGVCGPLMGGETLKFTGIPYPKPEEISIAVGDTGPQGRKVMISLMNRIFGDENNCLFVYLNPDMVPTSGWTRVMQFGKVTWTLMPESRPLDRGRFHHVVAAQQAAGGGSGSHPVPQDRPP